MCARGRLRPRPTQGIAVFGFCLPAGGLDAVVGRYNALHPTLVASPGAAPAAFADGVRVFECFAYYKTDKATGAKTADLGGCSLVLLVAVPCTWLPRVSCPDSLLLV